MNPSIHHKAIAAAGLLMLFACGGLVHASRGDTIYFAAGGNGTTKILTPAYSPDGQTSAPGFVTVNNGTKCADNTPFCVVFTLMSSLQCAPGFSLVNSATGDVLSLSGSPSSSSQILTGAFAAGTRADTNLSFSIALLVNPQPIPDPGSYTFKIRESLYSGSSYDPSGDRLVQSAILTVRVMVGSYYDVSIVPAGSAFSLSSTSQTLNFGILLPGQSLSADILVRTNVQYRLSLTSVNQGSLVNVADRSSAIGYTLTANGSPVPLSPGPGMVASGAPPTYGNPKRYDLAVRILPFADNPAAGNYSDTIIVTVAAP
jgi:spore coat protein U-like protein